MQLVCMRQTFVTSSGLRPLNDLSARAARGRLQRDREEMGSMTWLQVRPLWSQQKTSCLQNPRDFYSTKAVRRYHLL